MAESVPVSQDAERQQPVPSAWRPALAAIVDALRQGNHRLHGIPDVASLDEATAEWVAEQIRGYGATLEPLPEAAWDHAVCMWELTFWDVIVDLFTTQENPSDLALHVRVRECGARFAFELCSVHVP